jgi:hypothetical protein
MKRLECRWPVVAESAILILLSALIGRSQPTITIPQSPYSTIRITNLPSEVQASQTPFSDTRLTSLYNSSIVIHNDDRREVTGICMIWTITDASGKSTTAIIEQDGYEFGRATTVIQPGSVIAASPIGWVQVGGDSKVLAMLGRDPHLLQASAMVAGAARISASIDAVIFEDGDIWGPNASSYDEDIVARKNAAVYLSRMARAAMDAKRDLATLLKDLAFRQYDAHTDFQAKWESQFAGMLRASGDNVGPLLGYFDSLPTPPKFTRHDPQTKIGQVIQVPRDRN